MGFLKLLFTEPLAFAIIAVPFLYSVIIHEVAHGWVAYRMGDPTAKWMGRLSLNPLRHLDPIGTLMLFLIGFGWAKPVPININNVPNRRKGLLFVSAAGITANILLAFTALLIFRFYFAPMSGYPTALAYSLGLSLESFVRINIILAAVNLVPIPPLDGSKILMAVAPRSTQYFLARLEPYGFFIIIGLFYLGVMNPLIGLFRGAIVTLIWALLP